MKVLTIELSENATAEVRRGDSWVTLSIGLADEFTGGHVAQLAPGVRVAIEPADELASTCTPTNWLSGIASGAFYAYRTLKVQRRVLLITNLTGRLRGSEISALALASARAVAVCLHRGLTMTDLEGWQETFPEPSRNGAAGVASSVGKSSSD
jgi:hypothetical protein